MNQPLPPCESCHRPMYRDDETPFPGSVRYDGNGVCNACASRHRRGLTGPATPPGEPVIPTLRPPPRRVLDGALCAQTDPEIFFPEPGGRAEEAKAVCNACPVRQACLEWAIDIGEHHGIFGGMNYKQRRAYANARKAAAQPSLNP